ncbi:MAG: MFS transporter [Candidatus Berkelbacteria bacterium]|nr:MFS transporter [Candidatus Berkelbacteria bacterium]
MFPKLIKSNIHIIAAIIVGIAGANASAIMPAIIGTLVSKGNMLQSQAGFIAALELLGTGIAILAIAPFVNRISASRIALFGALFFLIINIISTQTENYIGLCVLRFLGGIGSGFLFGIMSKILGTSKSPERMFSMFFVGHISVSFGAFQLWTWLDSFSATQGPYIWLSFLSLTAVIASFWIAKDYVKTEETKDNANTISIPLCTMALLAMFLLPAAANGAWSFVIGMGNARGIDTETLLLVISYITLAGLMAALGATWLGSKIGTNKPILIVGSVFLLSMAVLALSETEALFILASVFFTICWVFINPYMLGVFSKLDSQGRLVTLSIAALYGGLSAGPAFMGLVIEHPNGGYSNMIYLSMVLLLMSLLLIIYASIGNEKRSDETVETVQPQPTDPQLKVH